ncbi:MAG TPA: 23S rRNA (guanosine(2251)-2'-O)-methyltransferase RlmB [Oligoflexia bacterium]|nr:23S rRNA (guanosine(2251)-2'-O)-methyltransferase RlmB [Oligoflexia bacterium]HMP48899.1 23S rRNA (guanosine(2251)-2'-O)-methyltransferase RlmB [Oligoflexia bacterium]
MKVADCSNPDHRRTRHQVVQPDRNDTGFCFGRKPISELIQHRPHRVLCVYVLKGAKLDSSFSLLLNKGKFNVVTLDEVEFDQFFMDKMLSGESHAGINHQGVCAEITSSGAVTLGQLLNRAKSSANGLIVALDQVQDPQNLGAIFRVVECAGLSGILYPERRSAAVSALVRKISAGATEFVPFAEVTNLSRALEVAKKEGFWVYGTALDDGSVSIYNSDINTPAILVFGSEGVGIRRQTMKQCDMLLHIPQYGLIQSMNVAASVAVVSFEFRRKIL